MNQIINTTAIIPYVTKHDVISIALIVLISCTCCQQGSVGQGTDRQFTPRLIGTCEGCEAVFEYGDRSLSPVDTLPDFSGNGQKIRVTGTIYESDGTTPAEGVILYVYHTDQHGIYAAKEGAAGWARRHGSIRGWMKTGQDGKYTFFTLKPGVYPDRSSPAHIHPVILEPDGKYYWLGSYHFKGDPLLTENEINPPLPRGGSSGLLELRKEGGLWAENRDIILGRNVAGYE